MVLHDDDRSFRSGPARIGDGADLNGLRRTAGADGAERAWDTTEELRRPPGHAGRAGAGRSYPLSGQPQVLAAETVQDTVADWVASDSDVTVIVAVACRAAPGVRET